MQSKNKAKQSKSSPKGYQTPSMFAALIHNRLGGHRVLNLLSHLEISSRPRLKSVLRDSKGNIDAEERSEKVFIQLAKKAVSSAILCLGFPRTRQLARSTGSKDSNGNIFASDECRVYINQL